MKSAVLYDNRKSLRMETQLDLSSIENNLLLIIIAIKKRSMSAF